MTYLFSLFMIFWEDQVRAEGYRRVRRDQLFLLPPDMRDWLPAVHNLYKAITTGHPTTSALTA